MPGGQVFRPVSFTPPLQRINPVDLQLRKHKNFTKIWFEAT